MNRNYDDDVRKFEGIKHHFTLRGYEFVARPIMPAQHVSALADIGTGVSQGRMFEIASDAIRATLDPDYREQWDQVLEQDHEVPISFELLMKIANDLVEDTTGRPPTQPSPSGSMGGPSSTESTDGSASTVVPASTP